MARRRPAALAGSGSESGPGAMTDRNSSSAALPGAIYRSHAGQILVKYWSKGQKQLLRRAAQGQILVKYRSNTGQIRVLVKYGSKGLNQLLRRAAKGQLPVKYSSNTSRIRVKFSQVLVTYRSNTGQIPVKYRSNTGQRD
jgi:hypothetical protein